MTLGSALSLTYTPLPIPPLCNTKEGTSVLGQESMNPTKGPRTWLSKGSCGITATRSSSLGSHKVFFPPGSSSRDLQLSLGYSCFPLRLTPSLPLRSVALLALSSRVILHYPFRCFRLAFEYYMTLGTPKFASIISVSSLRTGRSSAASVRRSPICILHNPTTPCAVINVPGTLSDQRQRSTLKKQSVVGTPVYPRNGGECAGVFTLE